jgi:Myb-like DNA-binding domain
MAPAQQRRGPKWTEDEDRKLIELIEGGKSWVLISAILKRSQVSIKTRAATLKRLSRQMVGLKEWPAK